MAYLFDESSHLVSWQRLSILGFSALSIAKTVSSHFSEVTLNADFIPEEGTLARDASDDIISYVRSAIATGGKSSGADADATTMSGTASIEVNS